MKINPENKKNHEEYHIFSSHIKNILITLSSRLILFAFSGYFIQIISCAISKKYYSLYTLTLVILLDTAYICIKRKGINFKWFSLTYFAYSTQIIISGWIVQSTLNNENNIDCQNDNITNKMMLHSSHCGLVKLNIYFIYNYIKIHFI